jgi:precorrin-6B methylase 2
VNDPLQPAVEDVLAAWRARCVADKEQVERAREVADPTDFYAPVTSRFRMDPRRTDDTSLNALLALAKPTDMWLDVGAGSGRYALPLALHVREVVAVDPSPSMLRALSEDAAEAGIDNVRVIEARWPMADGSAPAGDVGLMAHVGYDIAEIGPFLDQLEERSSRLVVAVMGESAMTTVATLYWEQIHAEPRVRLPAMPELLVLLTSLGRLPSVTLVERAPPTFESLDEAQAMARRQLWLREGSQKDEQLRQLVSETVTAHDGRYAFDWKPTRIGIISWSPRETLA